MGAHMGLLRTGFAFDQIPTGAACTEAVEEAAACSKIDFENLCWIAFRDGVILWLGAPVAAAAMSPLITCEGGAPTVCLIVYVSVSMLSTYSEVACLNTLRNQVWSVEIESFPELSFNVPLGSIIEAMQNVREAKLSSLQALIAFGVLEMLDVLTDYIFPMVARACDPAVTDQWLVSWQQTPQPMQAAGMYVARTFNFWGVAAFMMFISVVLLQGVRGSVQTYLLFRGAQRNEDIEASQIALAFDFACHLVLGEIFEQISDIALVRLNDTVLNMQAKIEDARKEIDCLCELLKNQDAEIAALKAAMEDVPKQKERDMATIRDMISMGLPMPENVGEVAYSDLEKKYAVKIENQKRTLAELQEGEARVQQLQEKSGIVLQEIENRKARLEIAKAHIVKTSVTRVITKVFGENVLQMWLQTTYMTLTWEDTSTDTKIKLVISVVIGMMSAASKTRKVILRSWDLLGCAVNIMLALCGLLVFTFCGCTAAKLCFAAICPNHMWNLTSGCVSASTSLRK